MLICFRSNLLPAVPFAHNADPTDFSYYGRQYTILHMEFFNKIKLEHVVYRFKSFAIYDEAFFFVLQNLQSRLYISNAVNSYHIAKLLILSWFIK